jgi:hypothetical protein
VLVILRLSASPSPVSAGAVAGVDAGGADETGADDTGADGAGADETGADAAGAGADDTGADGAGADDTGADGAGAELTGADAGAASGAGADEIVGDGGVAAAGADADAGAAWVAAAVVTAASVSAGAAFLAAATFFAGAFFAAEPFSDPSSSACAAGAAFFAADFLPALISSGCSGRVRPSRSARRRRRSACASMIVDDWLFASTPIAEVSASISEFVIPSSFASSCTRTFFAKTWSAFRGCRGRGSTAARRRNRHSVSAALESLAEIVQQFGQRSARERTSPRPFEPLALLGEREALGGAQPCAPPWRRPPDASESVGSERAADH